MHYREGGVFVSIHAPHAGGDDAWRNRFHALDISCHNCGLTAPSDLMKNAACLVKRHLSEGMLVSGLANVPENPCSLEVRAR